MSSVPRSGAFTRAGRKHARVIDVGNRFSVRSSARTSTLPIPSLVLTVSMSFNPQSGEQFHLFGYPIAHSAAPAFHNACFDGLGRTHRFACWSTSRITQEMLDETHSEATGGAA